MKNRNIDVCVSQLKNGFVNIYLGNDDTEIESIVDVRTPESIYIKCNGKVVHVDFSTEETTVNLFNEQE